MSNNFHITKVANGFETKVTVISPKLVETTIGYDTHKKRGYIAVRGEIVSSFLTNEKNELIDFDGITRLTRSMITGMKTAKITVSEEFELN